MSLEKAFDQHREDVLLRLGRIEGKIDKVADHTHKDKVSWAALIPLIIALVVGLAQVAI